VKPRGLLASFGDAALRAFGPAVASQVDSVAARALWYRSSGSRARSRAESMGAPERLVALRAIADAYGAPELFASAEPFFGAARVIAPRERDVGRFDRGGVIADVTDLAWESRVTPYLAVLDGRVREVTENHTARARWIRGRGAAPRSVAILVHGYRAGRFAFEERAWPIASLVRRGLDVLIAQLPHHADRARPGGSPRFPGTDPRITNEGFGQAIRDLRDLVQWARHRGAPSVVASGMSLGGYTVALLGTVERLDFLAPFIPLGSLADAARDNGRLVGTLAEQREQHEALEAAYRVASPLARPPLLAKDRVVVVGAEGDRITPIAHARRIAAHYDADLVTYPGGHILQVGRGVGFRAILERMVVAGITSG
jgi:dienelactone hydrolase